MNISVKGYRILLKPEEIQEKFKSTLDLVKPESTKEGEYRNIQKGEVLQIGADCYKSNEVSQPWCKVGDKVIINRGSGHNFYDDKDNWFIIVNEEDILATV
jgi:co-chaperonin GroES (HSP10)